MRAIVNQIMLWHFLQHGTIWKYKYVEFKGEKALQGGPGEGKLMPTNGL